MSKVDPEAQRRPDTKVTIGLPTAAAMWMTPVARDDQKSPEAHMAMKARMKGGPRSTVTSLNVQAKVWPTPTAAEGGRGSDRLVHNRPNGPSIGQVALSTSWPTPRARDCKGDGYEDGLSNVVRSPQAPTTETPGLKSSPTTRVLNPRFTEWLMGWPVGWSDPTSSATASFRSWLRLHSCALRTVLGWENAA